MNLTDGQAGTSAAAPAETRDKLADPVMTARSVSVNYGDKCAVRNVSLDIGRNQVLALIGPSGCGKSTFLRCLNRMNDTISNARVEGSILLDGKDIHDKKQDVVQLRARVGMVFQKPNPFPKSIYENVAYGPRIHGLAGDRVELDEIVHSSLQRAGLWEEVKDSLDRPGGALSGGQQQRLCIARSLAVDPDVLLMDEPCSALDPTSTRRIEETIGQLREQVTIVIVTHNMQQARRVSQRCAFFLAEQGSPGGIVESGDTTDMFERPSDQRTLDYVNGRFG